MIQIAHDPGTGAVEVLDPIFLEHLGGPVRARRDGAFVHRWVLRNHYDSARRLSPRLSYEVVLRPSDGTATGRMRPAGFVGRCSAPGRCRVQD